MGTEKVDEQLPAEWVLYDVAGVRTSVSFLALTLSFSDRAPNSVLRGFHISMTSTV
jgi:hypothetical protein